MSGKSTPFTCDLGILWTVFEIYGSIHLSSEIVSSLVQIEAHEKYDPEEQVDLVVNEVTNCGYACKGRKERCPFKSLR